MADHVMIDIETLGTGNEAALLSIGACKFNASDPTIPITDSFYVAIDPVSCQALGMKIDAATVMWWLDDARAEARSQMMKENRIDVVSALDGFKQWYGYESLPTWGNGATFDNVVMRSAYAKLGEEAPWKFWHDRCYRTMKSLGIDIRMDRVGVHHNALDDAISQAQHLQKLAAHLRLEF